MVDLDSSIQLNFLLLYLTLETLNLPFFYINYFILLLYQLLLSITLKIVHFQCMGQLLYLLVVMTLLLKQKLHPLPQLTHQTNPLQNDTLQLAHLLCNLFILGPYTFIKFLSVDLLFIFT